MKKIKLTITFGIGLLTLSVQAQEISVNGTFSELRQLLDGKIDRVTLTAYEPQRAQADQLMVTATVKTESKTLAGAISANRDSREQLNQALIARGVSGTNVIYKPFSFSTESTYFGRKIRGYSVSSRVRITVHTETEFTDVVCALESNGETWKFDSFAVQDSAAAANREIAMRKTLAELRRRKAMYEDEFNIELTPVSFSERGRHGASHAVGVVSAQSAHSPGSRRRSSEPETVSYNDSFGEVLYRAPLAVEFDVKRTGK